MRVLGLSGFGLGYRLVAERSIKKQGDTSTDARVEIETIRAGRDLWVTIVQGITQVLIVLAFSAPLYCSYLAISTLAGRTTNVSPGLAYAVAAMVGGPSALAVWLSGRAKSKSQSNELIRLRQRITELENEREARS